MVMGTDRQGGDASLWGVGLLLVFPIRRGQACLGSPHWVAQALGGSPR